MKNLLIIGLFIFSACGPATESREKMDSVAKRTSDSLENSLDSALNDPNISLLNEAR